MTDHGGSDIELIWPGKRQPQIRTPLPLICLERFGSKDPSDWTNRVIKGDNMDVMCSLLSRLEGRIDLIYIDPPFGRGKSRTYRREVEHAGHDRTTVEQTAYDDWSGRHLADYLQMLYDRLSVMYRLLSPTGSIYLHLDQTVVHEARLVMDEIFGRASFQRQLIWRIGWISGFKSRARNWIRNHDTILYYVRDPARVTFNKQYIPYAPGYVRRDGAPPAGPGHPIDDVWNASPAELALTGKDSLDSIQIKSFSREKTGYPTQKNISLVERIIRASSNEGDIVADFFCGSGTTAVAAERLGRNWICCDVSELAVHTTRKRLLAMSDCRPFEIMGCGSDWSESPDDGIVDVSTRLMGRVVSVQLSCVTGSDLIDCWMVDFDHSPGGPVAADWWSTAQGQNTASMVSAPYHYTRAGIYHILVRVVDVFGQHSDRTTTVRID